MLFDQNQYHFTKDCTLIFNPLSHKPNYEPFPKEQILDSSKLTEFADNNFNSVINDRNFFKRV